MGSIHGVLPGGKVITNVDVFRKLYETVGLGWVYSITKYGPVNKIANKYGHGSKLLSNALNATEILLQFLLPLHIVGVEVFSVIVFSSMT